MPEIPPEVAGKYDIFELEIQALLTTILVMKPPVGFAIYSFPTLNRAYRVAMDVAAADPDLHSLVDAREVLLETASNPEGAVVVLGGHIDNSMLRRAQTRLAESGGKFVAGTLPDEPVRISKIRALRRRFALRWRPS